MTNVSRLGVQELETRLFIGNEFVEATSGEFIPLHDPSNGKHLVDVPSASNADVDKAVVAAQTAQKLWAQRPYAEWSSAVRNLAKLVRENALSIVARESVCMGKVPLGGGPAMGAVAGFEYFSNLPASHQGKTFLSSPGVMSMTVRQPLGVVGAILPWFVANDSPQRSYSELTLPYYLCRNSPLILFANKVAPCVLAGNAVVIKSSERSPLCLLELAKLIEKAGFPPGLINIVNGGAEVGSYLASHPLIRKMTFTGSILTGRAVARAAIDSNLKRVTLELGGKSPALVFDDADLDVAVTAIEASLAYQTGQICMGTSRIYVQKGIYDRFLKAYTAVFTARKVGDPFDPQTSVGPLCDKRAYDSVQSYLQSAREQGGKLVDAVSLAAASNSAPPTPPDPHGYFVLPTIVTGLPESARCVREEIFGPVVHICPFIDEAEAVRLANDSDYGLFASVFTSDGSRALRVAQAIDAGTVTINQAGPAIVFGMPFGGTKQSGWGKEIGSDALEFYSEEKTIIYKLLASKE